MPACHRLVGMTNTIFDLFMYHPAGVAGSLVAGPARLKAAREDAKPLVVEQPGRWARLREHLGVRRVYRPLAAS